MGLDSLIKNLGAIKLKSLTAAFIVLQFAHIREELHPGRFSMNNKSEVCSHIIYTSPCLLS